MNEGASNCHADGTSGLVSNARDDSGYTIHADGGTATVSARNGDTINAPYSPTGAGTITDSNGNELSTGSTGTIFTDTLGTTALSITGTQTSPPMYYNYTDSSGLPQKVEVDFTAYYVQTHFQCGTIQEQIASSTTNLPTAIKYPDGSQYLLNYEQTPGQASNYITGRIAKVTLPTGGTISYSYAGGANGIQCTNGSSDGSNAGLTRVTPDGTYTYTRSGSGSAWETVLKDPASTEIDFYFQTGGSADYYEAKRVITPSGATSPIRTIFTCYNGATGDCTSTALALPVSRQTIVTQLDNKQESEVDTQINSYGLSTERDEYDFGPTAPPAAPLRVLKQEPPDMNHLDLERAGDISAYAILTILKHLVLSSIIPVMVVVIIGALIASIFEQSRVMDYLIIGPTFCFPAIAGAVSSYFVNRMKGLSRTALVIWFIPALVFGWYVRSWRYQAVDNSWLDIWNNFVGTKCSSSECMYELITASLVSSLAYAVIAYFVSRERGAAT